MFSRRSAIGLAAAAGVGLAFGRSSLSRASVPSFPGGTFTDLGSPVLSLTMMHGDFGYFPDGRRVLYTVVATANAVLNIVDVDANQLIETIPLPGAAGAWALCVASDQSVYVGTYTNGHLYRYVPGDSTATDLGVPVPGATYIYSLTAGNDGTVYGGTALVPHVFSYRPGVGFHDFGPVSSTEKYTRSVAWDPDHGYLFAGVGSRAGLVRIDVSTGQQQTFLVDELVGEQFVYELSYAAGKVFAVIRSTSNRLVCIDAVSGAVVPLTDNATGTAFTGSVGGVVSPLSPDGASVLFTSNGQRLRSVEVATGTVRDIIAAGAPVVAKGAGIGYAWLTTSSGTPQVWALTGNYNGDGLHYEPTAGTVTNVVFPVQPGPVNLYHLYGAGDGRVYVTPAINGASATYTPATGVIAKGPTFGQVEGTTWANGKLYCGVYPNGRVIAFDPSQPVSAANPAKLFELLGTDQQHRPTALTVAAGRLYVGSMPNYGTHGGALTICDLGDGSYAVHRNIVQDQTVSAVLVHGGVVYGGTGIIGGEGTTPIATEARLFTADPLTGAKLSETTPVPGASVLNALTIGPDGHLWALGDGTLVIIDPANLQVLHTTAVFSGSGSAYFGALITAPNGFVYGSTGSRFFVVDPLTYQASMISTAVRRLTLGTDGGFYTLGNDSFGVLNRLVRYSPEAAAPDVRQTVWCRDMDSKVRNRYVSHGVTLSDRCNELDREASHGAFVRHVAKLAEGLAASSVLTNREADGLSSAAARSS